MAHFCSIHSVQQMCQSYFYHMEKNVVVEYMNDSSQYHDIDIWCHQACLIIGHLGQTPPFPSISGNNASLPRSSLQLSQSFLQLTLLFWTSVSPSHRLRCWQLSYTRSCIRKKKKKTDICKRLERWRRLQCLSDYVFIVLIIILF